jgi:hypothetical protein
MRRIFAAFLVFSFMLFGTSSCSLSDDGHENFYFEPLEVVSADFPETFKYGDIYKIKVTSVRPSNCHFFEGFDFTKTGETERTIIGIATVFSENDCEDLTDQTFENYFDFEVLYTNTYIFKLWTGQDNDGENEYLTIEVPVVEE